MAEETLNLYKNLRVLRAKDPEALASLISSIKGQLFRVEQFGQDDIGHYAYIVFQRNVTIKG